MQWKRGPTENFLSDMSSEQLKFKEMIQQAFEGLGPDAFRQAIMNLGSAQLTMAVQNVFSDVEWVEALYTAVREPQHANLQWLCKLMDKLVPNPQSVKSQVDTPDQFVVMYENPKENEDALPK